MDKFEFWVTITGILSGIIGLSLKMCLKSKCEDVKCCFGMFNVHRNVEVEEDLEMNINRVKTTDSASI